MPEDTDFLKRKSDAGERTSDLKLLRRYADECDQGAFAEITRRHLGWVYSAALRRVGGDVQLAEDVAQQTFMALAQKAAAVARQGSMTGWLYAATRHGAANVVRRERRRKVREQEAHTLNDSLGFAAFEPEWSQVAPLLDAAIDELGEGDRAAVLARFAERQTFVEMGAALRISQDAARMRVERALAKLRARLARRGVTSTEAALGIALAHHAVVAAPAGLARTVATAALSAGTSVAGLGQLIASMKIISFVAVAGVLAMTAWLIGIRGVTLSGHAQEGLREATAAAATVVPVAAKSGSPSKLPPSAEGKMFLARHPEVNRALIAWAIASTRAEWASFIRAHRLTGAQLDEFVGLIRHIALDPRPGPDGKEFRLEVEPTLRVSELNGRLRALLGDGGPEQVGEFKRLRPARNFADKITEALCFSDAPLTTDQWGSLVQILDRNRAEGVNSATVLFQWDGVIADAQRVLSGSQLTVLDGFRAEDRYQQAMDGLSWSMTMVPEESERSLSDRDSLASGVNGRWVRAIRRDPTLQTLHVAARRWRVEMQFAPLCRALNLTPEEQRNFFSSLMSWEVKIADIQAATDAQDISDLDEVVSPLLAQASRECEAAQRELLGEENHRRWQEFAAASLAREMVAGFAKVATAGGAPLGRQQRDDLVALLRVPTQPPPDRQISFFKDVDWPRIDAEARAVLNDEQLVWFRTTEWFARSAITRFFAPLEWMIEQAREADTAVSR